MENKFNKTGFEYSKSPFLYDWALSNNKTEEIVKRLNSFLTTKNQYSLAIREICNKLETLNNNFNLTLNRNPIQLIHSRLKSPKSIINKLQLMGLEQSLKSACQNLKDIAVVRIICQYPDDIYFVANSFLSLDDITLLEAIDYIKNPKPNGYRSLHLIITIPVFLYEKIEIVKAEIQIRTCAMDLWASMEHEILFKFDHKNDASISSELKGCAELIAEAEKRIQCLINRATNSLNP